MARKNSTKLPKSYEATLFGNRFIKTLVQYSSITKIFIAYGTYINNRHCHQQNKIYTYLQNPISF